MTTGGSGGSGEAAAAGAAAAGRRQRRRERQRSVGAAAGEVAPAAGAAGEAAAAASGSGGGSGRRGAAAAGEDAGSGDPGILCGAGTGAGKTYCPVGSQDCCATGSGAATKFRCESTATTPICNGVAIACDNSAECGGQRLRDARHQQQRLRLGAVPGHVRSEPEPVRLLRPHRAGRRLLVDPDERRPGVHMHAEHSPAGLLPLLERPVGG